MFVLKMRSLLTFRLSVSVNSQCVPLEGTSTTTTTVGWPIEASCDDHVYDALGYDYYEAINEDGFIPFVVSRKIILRVI